MAASPPLPIPACKSWKKRACSSDIGLPVSIYCIRSSSSPVKGEKGSCVSGYEGEFMGTDVGLSHPIESPLIESTKTLRMGSAPPLINTMAGSGSCFLVTDAIASAHEYVIE